MFFPKVLVLNAISFGNILEYFNLEGPGIQGYDSQQHKPSEIACIKIFCMHGYTADISSSLPISSWNSFPPTPKFVYLKAVTLSVCAHLI